MVDYLIWKRSSLYNHALTSIHFNTDKMNIHYISNKNCWSLSSGGLWDDDGGRWISFFTINGGPYFQIGTYEEIKALAERLVTRAGYTIIDEKLKSML